MSTRIAYIIVIVIWSTTPLAIQWSGQDVGYRFGVTSRMVLGLVSTVALLMLLRGALPLHSRAIKTYIASGLGIYSAMSCVYWAAQLIPSGWISIIFGLSPLITGILAAIFLDEDALLPHKLIGIALGFIGLLITFGQGFEFGKMGLLAILATLVGTIFHCISAVTVKRIDAGLTGIAVTAGGLLVAVPLYLLTWFLTDSEMPGTIEWRAALAIIYLGTVGTAVGFVLYYYVLKHMDVSRVSLITLITPVCAIGLGYWLNQEPLSYSLVLGTGCILLGLFCYQFGPSIRERWFSVA